MSEAAKWASDVFGSLSLNKYAETNSEGYSAFESLQSSVSKMDKNNSMWIRVGSKLSPHYQLNEKLDWFEDMKKRKDQNRRLLISTKDNTIFRLYITEMTEYDDPVYQKRFCKFLRTLSPTQTLHIHTGNGCYDDYPIYTYGCMIDAIQRTSGKVITNLNGRSSFSEVVLWMYGHERYLSEFATVSFIGLQKHLEWSPCWRSYFETILDRAVEIKIITNDEKNTLLTTNKTLYLSYRDVIDRIHAKDADVETDENETIEE